MASLSKLNAPWAHFTSLLALFTLTHRTYAQTTDTFTDPLTGIIFQRFFGAKTSFGFGVALPENPSSDFIGQLDAPMPDGKGWAGVSLQDDMVGPLLIVAWPNGNEVVSSFRKARNEDDSPPIVQGDFSIVEIPQGTVANDTHMDTKGKFGMGWALADRAVSDPAYPAAQLPFHNVGFDEFDAILSQARNPLFGEWAQLAGAHVVSNGSTTADPIDPPGQETGGDDSGDDDDESGNEDSGVDSDSDSDDD